MESKQENLLAKRMEETLSTLEIAPSSVPATPSADLPSRQGQGASGRIYTPAERELVKTRAQYEVEAEERGRLVSWTNHLTGRLYVEGNRVFRDATGEVLSGNKQLTDPTHREICNTFNEFMTDELSVHIVGSTRWGMGNLQGIASRPLEPPKPPEGEIKQYREVTRKRPLTLGERFRGDIEVTTYEPVD